MGSRAAADGWSGRSSSASADISPEGARRSRTAGSRSPARTPWPNQNPSQARPYRRASSAPVDRSWGFLRSFFSTQSPPESEKHSSVAPRTSQIMLSTRCSATQMENPGRGAAGISLQTQTQSVSADVHGAIAHPERRLHQPGRVAAAIDEADIAEAETNVMMEAPATAPAATAPAERLGGSSGRRQRGGAQRSCGNESKSELAKHGHSPVDAPSALPGRGLLVTHRPIRRVVSETGSDRA